MTIMAFMVTNVVIHPQNKAGVLYYFGGGDSKVSVNLLRLSVRRIGVEGGPCLHELLGRHLKEFRVSKLANELLHGGIVAGEAVRSSGSELLHLEHSGVLGEGLKSLVGLRQVEADGGDGLGEPGLLTTVGGASVRGLANRGGSGDAPVTGGPGAELALTTVGVSGRDVRVLHAIVEVNIEGGGRCRERMRTAKREIFAS